MEYRYHWQTWVGISMLMAMLLFTMFLPDAHVKKNNGDAVIRVSVAQWALTVEEDDIDTTHIQYENGKKPDNDVMVSALRLWGWMLLGPIMLIIVTLIFMIIRKRTLSVLLVTNALITIICEITIRLYVPDRLFQAKSFHSASSVAVLIVAVLVLIYGILCMTVFNKYGNKNSDPYNNVYAGTTDIEEHDPGKQIPNVRTIGILKGVKGEYAGQTLEIHAGEEIILGRDPQYCMLIFSNPRVSRRQCGIRYDVNNGYYQAIDYSSTGTTLSDGTLLTTSEYTPLPPGTVLYMAKGQEAIQLM